jgi:two-component system chemotaxis sensor kinase CheA
MGEVLIHGLQNEDFIRKLNTSLDLNFSAREMVKKLRGIYENVLQVRMNPLNLITDKLPRTVRDLARQTGKIIQIEMSGTDILMDRSILEELDSPLLHIIRNCIDHGIETPQERKKAGKPERGTISLRTQLDQGLVEIEIRDDGKGLNPQKIREKAIEKKILTPEQSGILTDEDIFMLICSPGFSTHTQVTDISGRGVGMDVVKNMVESYDGFLDIQSVLHEGTKFTIRLPVTVSIVNVLLFKVEKQTYAFPISRIDRTVEIPKEKIQKQQGKDVFIYEDQMVPLINLNHLLGFETSDGNNKGYPVVLVERRGKQFGIRVSSLLGQEEVVLKPLSKALKEIEIIFGATILANGRPTFILDVNKIIQMV